MSKVGTYAQIPILRNKIKLKSAKKTCYIFVLGGAKWAFMAKEYFGMLPIFTFASLLC